MTGCTMIPFSTERANKMAETRVREIKGWPILAGTKRRAVGGIGGGRSTFFVYPDDDVAVIVMTNLVGANPQNLIDTIAGHYIAKGSQ